MCVCEEKRCLEVGVVRHRFFPFLSALIYIYNQIPKPHILKIMKACATCTSSEHDRIKCGKLCLKKRRFV